MSKDLIKNEISSLNLIRLDWTRTKMKKSSAFELVNRIDNFEHTFSVNFPYSEKYFKTDPFVKVDFYDAKEEIEYYSKGNLKFKDNQYFQNGIKHLNRAMNKIIDGLAKQIN
jgi:hypothetical protein